MVADEGAHLGAVSSDVNARASSTTMARRILFVLPNSDEFGGLERHLLQLLERLIRSDLRASILVFGPDVVSERLDPEWAGRILVATGEEPKSLWEWVRLLRRHRSDVVVFCYGWIFSFPWHTVPAAMLAGIHRRFAIQHLVLPTLPVPYPGGGLYGVLRRNAGSARVRSTDGGLRRIFASGPSA